MSGLHDMEDPPPDSWQEYIERTGGTGPVPTTTAASTEGAAHAAPSERLPIQYTPYANADNWVRFRLLWRSQCRI